MGPVAASAAKLIALNVSLLILAVGAVALRLISTRIRRQTLQAHDYLCIFSLLCLIGYTIDLIIGAVHGGIGLHMTHVPLAKVVVALKVFFACEFFWSTGVASFRLAVLLLYINIFRRPAFFRAAVATAAVVCLYYVACVLTVCLLCRPINYNWNKLINGKCANTEAIEIFSAAFNMVLDIWVVCLPLPIVWRLQMPKPRKFGISATFALGLAIAGINLGRLIQTIQCNAEDFTYCLMGSSMIVVGEMSTGILVACVPTLGPVFFPSRFGPSAKARYQYKESRRTPLHNVTSRRTPLHGPASDISGKRPFTALKEDEIELRDALNNEDGYQVRAAHSGASEKPDCPIQPNEIGVTQDFHIYETAREA